MFGFYELMRANMMDARAWLDIAITRCPNCGRHYTDASWYIIEMASDIECGSCHANFSTKRNLTDRIMLSLKVDGNGKVEEAEVAEHV